MQSKPDPRNPSCQLVCMYTLAERPRETCMLVRVRPGLAELRRELLSGG